MAAAAILDDRKSLSIAFLALSDQYATFIVYFYFFVQYGRRRIFWMTENYFQSHISPFQINTQIFYFFQNFVGQYFAKIDRDLSL